MAASERSLIVREDYLDAIEEVATFFGTYEIKFPRGWRDEVISVDDLWEYACLAVYGVTENPHDKQLIWDPQTAFLVVMSQVDYPLDTAAIS